MSLPAYFYITIIYIVLWFFLKNHSTEKIVNLIGYYALVFITQEILAWLYSYLTHKSNHWIYNIITPIQVVFMLFVYQKISLTKKYKSFISLVIVIFVIFTLLNILFIQSFFRFNTYSYIFGCLLLLITCLKYFIDLHKTEISLPIFKSPFFWITTGNLIYYAGSMFYMGSINYILDKQLDDFGDLVNIFVYLFTSLQFLFFLFGLLCSWKAEQKF